MKKFFCILIVTFIFVSLFTFSSSAADGRYGLSASEAYILENLEYFSFQPYSCLWYEFANETYYYASWQMHTPTAHFYGNDMYSRYVIYTSTDLLTWNRIQFSDGGASTTLFYPARCYRDGYPEKIHILWSNTNLWLDNNSSNPFFLQGPNPFPKKLAPVVGLTDFSPVYSEVSGTLSTVLPVGLVILSIMLGVFLIRSVRVFLR